MGISVAVGRRAPRSLLGRRAVGSVEMCWRDGVRRLVVQEEEFHHNW